MHAFLSLAMSYGMAAAAAPPPSNLIIEPCDGGEQYQFAEIECEIPLRNAGDKPIRVMNARALLESDWIQKDVLVAPKSTAYLTTKVQLLGGLGHVRHPFQFDTDEKGQEVRGSHVRAFVLSDLEVGKPVIDFGPVLVDEPLPTKRLELASKETTDFRILKVLDKPEFLDAKISADGRSIEAKLKPDAPWGVLVDQRIVVSINTPHQDRAWIGVAGQVVGDVVPSANPYSMGLLRVGNKNEALVRLTSRSKKSFEIGNVALDGIQGTVKAEDCEPKAPDCKLVRVSLSEKQPTGRLQGTLRVELPSLGRTLPVQISGLYLEKDFPIRDLNEDLAKASGESPVTQVQPKIDLRDALRAGADVDPPGRGPLLKWSVANERTIYGYVIYRSNKEAGPFLRINDSIVRAQDVRGSAARYAWRDESAEAGKTYWYYVGMLKHDGTKENLTAPQKVVAK